MSNQNDIENVHIAVAGDDTHIRISCQLGDVETAPIFSDNELMLFFVPFLTSFQTVYDDSESFAPPMSRFVNQDGDHQ